MGHNLIVCGDDFGFSQAYNHGMVHAYTNGILTVGSLMSNMDAAVHAVALAKMVNMPLAQHTNLVQGRPCADPKTIPSIVQDDGSFYPSKYFKADGLAKKGDGTLVADKEDVKRETRAQLERQKALSGKYPTQVEGHSVIQPTMIEAYIEVAQEYGIRYMNLKGEVQSGFRNAQEFFISTPDMTHLMIDYMEKGLTADTLLPILEALKANKCDVNIFRCHPGWVDATIMDTSTLVLPRCRDVQALTDKRVVEWVKANGIELLSFDDLVL